MADPLSGWKDLGFYGFRRGLRPSDAVPAPLRCRACAPQMPCLRPSDAVPAPLRCHAYFRRRSGSRRAAKWRDWWLPCAGCFQRFRAPGPAHYCANCRAASKAEIVADTPAGDGSGSLFSAEDSDRSL